VTTIHVNPLSPQKIVMKCTAGDSANDMRQVTSSVLKLKRPDGTIATLSAIISDQTQSQLTLSHLFEVGDVPKAGVYRIYPVHSMPTGTIRGATQQFEAVSDFT